MVFCSFHSAENSNSPPKSSVQLHLTYLIEIIRAIFPLRLPSFRLLNDMTLDESVLHEYSKKYELQEVQNIKLSYESISALEVLLHEVHSSLHPSKAQYEHRRHLVYTYNVMIWGIFGNVGGFPLVEAFGSFIMDMFTADSDLDLSINFSCNETSPCSRDRKIATLKKFVKVLQGHQRKGSLRGVQSILNARVPIVKFVDCATGIECDVSVDNKDGVVKSSIIFLISSIDERFQVLSCLMKLWAKAHKINSSKDHTLNSLSIILLVAFHLQTRDPPILPPFSAILNGGRDPERLHDKVLQFKHFGRENKESIAELFIALMCKLLSARTLWPDGLCASVYEGSWISKEWNSEVGVLSVEDFTDRSQNCARAVKEKQFKRIYDCIGNTMEQISLFKAGHIDSSSFKKMMFFHVNSAPLNGVIDNGIVILPRKQKKIGKRAHRRALERMATEAGPSILLNHKKIGKRHRDRALDMEQIAIEAGSAIPPKRTRYTDMEPQSSQSHRNTGACNRIQSVGSYVCGNFNTHSHHHSTHTERRPNEALFALDTYNQINPMHNIGHGDVSALNQTQFAHTGRSIQVQLAPCISISGARHQYRPFFPSYLYCSHSYQQVSFLPCQSHNASRYDHHSSLGSYFNYRLQPDQRPQHPNLSSNMHRYQQATHILSQSDYRPYHQSGLYPTFHMPWRG